MSEGPVLHTERLILRPTRPEDLEPWIAFAADAEVMRFLGGVLPPSTAWRGFMSMAGAWAMTGEAMFSVIEKATGDWVGRIGPWVPLGWPGTEVGWGLSAQAWGKGYAVEAAEAALDWVFEVRGWTDVIHCIDPENTPSQKVAERLGSANRGPGRLPPPYEDHPVDIWGQTREMWQARRG